MSSVTVFVGLDYHQSGVQVCVLDGTGRVLRNEKVANGWREIERVVRQHQGRVFAAIEACTGAADLAEELITHAGWSVDLAHPGYVARLKQSPDKTDFSDARLLADLERVGYLPKVWLAPEEVRELRRLTRYRQQLVNERRSLKLRIRALLRDQRLRPAANAWTKAWWAWLEIEAELSTQGRWIVTQQKTRLEHLQTEIRQVEQRLATLTAGDPMVQKLLTFKGVGLVTAVTLRAEIGRVDRFRGGKQLSRFCGVTPWNASSGTRQADAGLIKAGNPELRRVLIETAHRLWHFDPRWAALAESLRRRGKPTCAIIAAIANRWVRWLYHQLQTVAA